VVAKAICLAGATMLFSSCGVSKKNFIQYQTEVSNSLSQINQKIENIG